MPAQNKAATERRFAATADEKSGGVAYTPKRLADFVARQMVRAAGALPTDRPLRILDPAIGHGELLVSLLEALGDQSRAEIEIYGFETDLDVLDTALRRLQHKFPGVLLKCEPGNFLEYIEEYIGASGHGNAPPDASPKLFDLIIANPPYVRTQVMGAAQAQVIAKRFGLAGRVDLYYAFILGMSQVLKPQGVAGIIVSNRFMTTKSGASVRDALGKHFAIRHAWDLGDTKLFGAAVLPAVLLVEGKQGEKPDSASFTTIYETSAPAQAAARDPIAALSDAGVIEVADGRRFQVQHGKLDTNGRSDGLWRIATDSIDAWLATVAKHCWGTFGDVGKIRVGVKTCADRIFIRGDWHEMDAGDRPELLKSLTTHRVARRFKPLTSEEPTQILYPHEVAQGRRCALDLAEYPKARAYLETHRSVLEGRQYVLDAGRKWYEIWVPQDPAAWNQSKLVFRDIAEEPTFWMDLEGSVVNGDCYWLVSRDPAQRDPLWLAAAIGNSTFIERFYDFSFNNKLYAGRRRFITQYVERFPLPDPRSPVGKAIIALSKKIYECVPSPKAKQLECELNRMVWRAFGLDAEDAS